MKVPFNFFPFIPLFVVHDFIFPGDALDHSLISGNFPVHPDLLFLCLFVFHYWEKNSVTWTVWNELDPVYDYPISCQLLLH